MQASFAVLSFALVAATASVSAQPAGAPSQRPPYQQGADDRGMQDAAEPPPTPEQKAQMAALGRYQQGLEASLRASASPRDQAVSAALMHADEPDGPDAADAGRGALLRKAAESAADDRLVQWLWAEAPAEVSGCTAASPCRHRGMALARLEPDNGAAWVPAVADAVRFNDAAGIDDALAHMAQAIRYDEVFHDSMVTWMDAFRRFPMPPELQRMPDGKAGDPTVVAASAAFAQISAITPPYEFLAQACDRQGQRAQVTAARLENCARAGRLMIDQSTTLGGRMVGADLVSMAGKPNAEDRERIRAAAWQMEQHMRLGQTTGANPAKARAQVDLLLSSSSEVAAMQDELRSAHVSLNPPAGWQPMRENGPQGEEEGPPPDSDQRR